MKFLLFSTFVACVLVGAYADLPRDVLTTLEDGRIGRCTAVEDPQGIAMSCKISPFNDNSGETPITYAEFMARVRNPSGVTADTAEAPEPTSYQSRGHLKQQLKTSDGPVPALILEAPKPTFGLFSK